MTLFRCVAVTATLPPSLPPPPPTSGGPSSAGMCPVMPVNGAAGEGAATGGGGRSAAEATLPGEAGENTPVLSAWAWAAAEAGGRARADAAACFLRGRRCVRCSPCAAGGIVGGHTIVPAQPEQAGLAQFSPREALTAATDVCVCVPALLCAVLLVGAPPRMPASLHHLLQMCAPCRRCRPSSATPARRMLPATTPALAWTPSRHLRPCPAAAPPGSRTVRLVSCRPAVAGWLAEPVVVLLLFQCSGAHACLCQRLRAAGTLPSCCITWLGFCSKRGRQGRRCIRLASLGATSGRRSFG